jgi:hypothetical protein
MVDLVLLDFPMAWTMYGLIVTQYGDLEDPITVPGESKQKIATM